MHDFRPHSFDTRAFFFGIKCLAVVFVLLVGVRYGTAFASGLLVREEPESAAAAVVVALTPPASTPTAPPEPAPAPSVEKPQKQLPKISAEAFIIADLKSGTSYASREADTPYPIASISKLLVALAARETFPSETEVTITAADRKQTEGTPGIIVRDETFTAGELLFPLLMESNNSVAYALERAGGGDEFVRNMLRIAHDIGMDETLLNDSSGLSAKNSASARDLLSLTRYIMQKDPELFEITRTTRKSITAESGRTYAIPNHNVYSSDPEFIGGKTGYTDEAKQTMIALFEEDGGRIAIIVLHSSDRKKDIEKLRAWYRAH